MPTRSGKIALAQVAPELKAQRGLAPCALLGRALTGSRPGKIAAWDQAKQLACLQYRFAKSLLEDSGTKVEPADWSWGQGRVRVEKGRIELPSALLDFPGWAENAQVSVRYETARLFDQIPEPLAVRLLAWAPPVVSAASRKGTRRVVANVLPALLACRALPPDHSVRCAVIVGSGRRTDLRSIALAVAIGLERFATASLESAVRSAADIPTAMALSGYTERWCRELRKTE